MSRVSEASPPFEAWPDAKPGLMRSAHLSVTTACAAKGETQLAAPGWDRRMVSAVDLCLSVRFI